MIARLDRYLGNADTLELHDTHEEQANCGLGEILPGQRRWYDSPEGARADKDYDYCYWCIGGSTR